MRKNDLKPQTQSGLDKRRFKLKPNVYYEDVPWFREEGVFLGSKVNRRGTVRLYAPEGTPEPRHIDVQSYWVTPVKD